MAEAHKLKMPDSVVQSEELHVPDGLEKAATFILVAGEEHAGKIFAKLDLDEIKEISLRMSNLGRVRGEMVDMLLYEFMRLMGGGGESLVGSFDIAERLLRRVLDSDKVAMIMDDIRGPAGRNIWEKLGNVDETVLASFLKNEYPQTIAVVLSKIRPEHAARVMTHLPQETTIDTMMRMLRMEVIQKTVLVDVEETLRNEFMSNLSRTQRRDHHEIMAEIFNYFDRTTEARYLEMLEERNREAADRIRALMFTFDDLVKLDGPGVQTLLRNIDNSKLGLALKGGSDKVKELFFANMSERAAKILREDMETMGPVKVKDVDEAQQELINKTKDLAAAGEITIAEDNDDELIE
jgi:flagellar motor switch protein FliG